MRVLCTAGHVDHGKSTLVAALTGTDPDRLAEEKRRGLTIDLGFAWTSMDGIGDVAFVDLPGHERFVPNMLAGAGPLSTALFVVAADEGWMPQSAEHLEILRLLGVSHGVVALTKADRVDVETLEIAAELIADELSGTGLASVPVVPVSATTHVGLDDLRQALVTMLDAAPVAEDRRRPRLWVDRSFSIPGAGTVVTGTLIDGRVSVGDHLQVWPRDRAVRVRGIQSLETTVEEAGPGSRVALNIVGVDVDEVPRGSMLGKADQWATTTTVDAWCEPSGGQTLGRRGAWTVHVGTAAVPAELYPTAAEDMLTPGPVRIELAQPLALAAGDDVVIRESGRSTTMGGGRVLDTRPDARPRGADNRTVAVDALRTMSLATTPAQRLSALVAHHDELPVSSALAAAGANDEDLTAAINTVDLVHVGRASGVGDGLLMATERWEVLSKLVVQSVLGTHQRRPALAAVDTAVPRQLLATTGAAAEVVEQVIAATLGDGRLEQIPGGVRVPGHEPRLTMAQQSTRTAVLDALSAAGLEAPPLPELIDDSQDDRDLIDALLRDGQLIRLTADRVITAGARDAAVARLRDLHDAVGAFSASDAREALGTTRKYLLPLLEHLDKAKVTRREGDLRVLRD